MESQVLVVFPPLSGTSEVISRAVTLSSRLLRRRRTVRHRQEHAAHRLQQPTAEFAERYGAGAGVGGITDCLPFRARAVVGANCSHIKELSCHAEAPAHPRGPGG